MTYATTVSSYLSSHFQVLQNVLNHSNKLVKSELGSQEKLVQGGVKVETNGGGGGGSPVGSDPEGSPINPPESQSPLHFLADLAEQKSREEKKGNGVWNSHFILILFQYSSSLTIKFPSLTENKESGSVSQSVLLAKCVKEEKKGESLEVLQQCKNTSLVASSTEQGSTLRDLLTTTAGKLKLGSTDAGIAFAPVYSTASQVCFS